tara:strand:- start:706 stop:1860 length:1155 start_codon:yes stop_codon:yes gene_type:complete
MKNITILGSTGSIGVNTLNVIDNLDQDYNIVGLSANTSANTILSQIKKYKPKVVAISDLNTAGFVKEQLKGYDITILPGRSGLLELSSRNDVDLLFNALVGSSGMEPTLCAIKSSVDVALSNKESLVMAGDIIESEKIKSGAKIFPVDSEHSAIWQCLAGEKIDQVEKIILTGSGGPFRNRDIDTLIDVKVGDALNHPNWEMGKKITIDSASMMNKGLEVIETKWLFGIDWDKIEIVIHPESIIHSMVEFKDKSVKAQMGVPDMKVPIQYALTYPDRKVADWESLDLSKIGSLNFEPPSFKRFPCISLAYEALKKGGSYPAVLNVANEQAVYRFLNNEISFIDIPIIIEKACAKHEYIKQPSLDELIYIETWTINFVKSFEGKN